MPEEKIMKNLSGGFWIKLLEMVFTKTTVSVIITSLIAPLLIQSISTRMENRKIQADLVKEILSMTRETNFNNETQLKRYQVYAQIVNDNQDMFQVNLAGTLSTVDLLFSDHVRKKSELDIKLSKLNSDIFDAYTEKYDIASKIPKLNDELLDQNLDKERAQKIEKQLIAHSDELIEKQQRIDYYTELVKYAQEDLAVLNKEQRLKGK